VGTPVESGDEPSHSKMLRSRVFAELHKSERYIEEVKNLTLKGVSYRFRDLCWTRARTAASKRAKSVEP
jgi:hypothetical protein